MLHFTHTGPLAGRPICGAVRSQTDEGMHTPWGNLDKVTAPDLCPKCKALAEEEEADDVAPDGWAVVTGDMAQRATPGTRQVVNSSGCWIVGPFHRSRSKAEEQLERIRAILAEE